MYDAFDTADPFRRQIQTRMGLTLIILTTVLLSGYGGYQYVTLRSSSLARLNALADTTSARLAESLANPIWNADPPLLEKLILAEIAEKTVMAIQVKDNKDRLLSRKGRDPRGRLWTLWNRSPAISCIDTRDTPGG